MKTALELRQWTSVNSLFQILSLLMYKNTISTLGKLTAINDLLSHAFISGLNGKLKQENEMDRHVLLV